jgi:hypothetical protein
MATFDTSCQNFFENSLVVDSLAGFHMILGIVLLGFVYWTNKQRSEGVPMASDISIFPIYSFGVGVLSVLHFVYGILYLTSGPIFAIYVMGSTRQNVYATAIYTFFIHFTLEGFALFFMQRTIGMNAIKSSLCYSFFLAAAVCAIAVTAQVYVNQESIRLIISLSFSFLFFVFYMILTWNICGVRFRPALKPYSAFMFFVYSLDLIGYTILLVAGNYGDCVVSANSSFLLAIVSSFFIYYMMIEDTKYWCGGVWTGNLDARFPEPDSNPNEPLHASSNIKAALMTTQMSTDVAASLAIHVDALQLHHNAQMLDFNDLYISGEILGTGASAKVMSGIYKRRVDVAVKVMMCMELTEDVVASFANEASITMNLQHPHIVHIYGFCVVPPALFLVMEKLPMSLNALLRVDI